MLVGWRQLEGGRNKEYRMSKLGRRPQDNEMQSVGVRIHMVGTDVATAATTRLATHGQLRAVELRSLKQMLVCIPQCQRRLRHDD
jgi:hypothetical protein